MLVATCNRNWLKALVIATRLTAGFSGSGKTLTKDPEGTKRH
jgi:hypothetical protein